MTPRTAPFRAKRERASRFVAVLGVELEASVRVWRGDVVGGSEFPDMGIVSPLAIGGTATVLQINTDDADGLWTRALDAGAGARHGSPTRSGASATASSATRSVTAGTSPNGSATSPNDEIVAAAAQAFGSG